MKRFTGESTSRTDLDPTLSPYTGWTRRTWEAHADAMLRAAAAYGSAGHARLRLPGPESASGRDSDELEGFARTFLLAAFRLKGAADGECEDLVEWYGAGLDAGTDPRSPERWPGLDDARTAQPRVEAASVALGLALTRERLWDRLDERVRNNVVDWLRPAVGAHYLEHNWLWFQMVTEAFLRSVGALVPGTVDGAVGEADRAWGLRRHELLYRADGWYSDGDGRDFDHYNGWAFHLYPLLWTTIEPDRDLADEYRARFEPRLRRYLDDAVHLVGGDGSPLIQGRSLIYRFAAAAPFWMGALTGATDLAPGLLRRAASGMVAHFAERGAPDERGLLPIGWHHEWVAMRQTYSGTGSPYWASKGMLGLALPASHPVWTAVEEPLPVERGDATRVVAAPGWAVSATRDDGIVRIANHGTDLVPEGRREAEHPLYARVGYSTATFPPLLGPDSTSPVAGAVSVLDDAGRGSHRTGFQARGTATGDGVAAALSRHTAFWLDDDGDGGAQDGPRVSVASVLRGSWEVRVVELAGAGSRRVRVGGWALAGEDDPTDVPGSDRDAGGASDIVDGSGLRSRVVDLAGSSVETGAYRDRGVSPLGDRVAVPWAVVEVSAGAPAVVAVGLARGDLDRAPGLTRQAAGLMIEWPDGTRTELVGSDEDGLREWRLASADLRAPVPPRATVVERPRLVVAVDPDMLDRLLDPADLARLERLTDLVRSPAGGRLEAPEAAEALASADIVLTGWGSGPVTRPLIEIAPRARLLVHAAGTVRPVIDEGSIRRGIQVSSMADLNALPVAEYATAMIALAAKRILPAGAYGPDRKPEPLGAEDGGFGGVVGIIGASRIGREVIARLRSSDLTPLVADPYLDDAAARRLGVERVELPELFARSRVVSLHAPLLDSTVGMVSAELLAAMPDGATLINTARGALVDEPALTAQVATGRISAILDVTYPEPPADDSPLWTLPGVLLTPHAAGTAGNELRRVGRGAVDEIERYVHGRRLRHEVTADAYGRTA
ncbi:DUF2264 domain-containing protein [Isoptericola sp. F-RaC21]|uniref:DUF2264 domain-containing protein n=1 Tax=Isoptericola sp. F-RaC21 TaxID=3141452 RepID=UPI00315C1F20